MDRASITEWKDPVTRITTIKIQVPEIDLEAMSEEKLFVLRHALQQIEAVFTVPEIKVSGGATPL